MHICSIYVHAIYQYCIVSSCLTCIMLRRFQLGHQDQMDRVIGPLERETDGRSTDFAMIQVPALTIAKPPGGDFIVSDPPQIFFSHLCMFPSL